MTVCDHFRRPPPRRGRDTNTKTKTFLRGKPWSKTIGRVHLPLVGGGH
jgi:hypothetical protein